MALNPASRRNVEITLSDWMATKIAAYTFSTAYFSAVTPSIFHLWPEKAFTLPCYSIIHIANSDRVETHGRGFDGTYNTMRARGMMEVSAWASRANAKWAAQLKEMISVIEEARIATDVVVIKDWTTAASPTTTSYKVELSDIEISPVGPDVNPDIERVRLVLWYTWLIRAI